MFFLPTEKLKEIILQDGIVDGARFDAALKEAERKRQDVADILISEGVINKDYLFGAIAKALGVERVNLRAIKINEEALRALPEDIARQRRVIVFDRGEDGSYKLAMENPTDLEAIDFLKRKLGAPIQPFLAIEEDLNNGFLLYQKQLTQDFKKLIEDSIRESLRSKARGDLKESASDLPIVALVDNLMQYAVVSRASDVHFEVLDDGVLVRYRIDGILHEIIRMPKEVHAAVVARIKILSNLRVDEHTHPQDGRFRYKIGQDFVDVRVSIIPTFYGEKIELRILSSSQKPVSLAELGMLEETLKSVESAIHKSYGMFFVCGPTGAGKTTTLYSILNMLNRPEVNIVTIEDPIEYDMRYLNQMQVNNAAGITFASGLRAMLRQDPNIIMVGEVRDNETADISVQAALTGHFVLASLHTNDAPTAIPRLIDMQIPPFLVAAALNAVSSQRLVRKIHLDCIESYAPDPGTIAAIEEQFKKLNIETKSGTVPIPKMFYRGKGCAGCNHTGYFGRLGIYEVLEITERVRKLIISPDFNLDNLRKIAREEGMETMFEDGMKKIERGWTTVEEVLRVIRE